jgi:DNA-binding NtrC family response regulator
MSSVLILDRELGFMWALAEQLQARGIATIPSSSVEEAQTVLAEFDPQISVVILNCRCHGVCSFASQLRKKYHPLRIIGIVSERSHCRACAHLLIATFHDPEDRDPGRLAYCVQVVSILVDHARALQ